MSTRRKARIRQVKGGMDLKVGLRGPHAFGIVCGVCGRLQEEGNDIVVLHAERICIPCASEIAEALKARKVR